MNPRSFILVLAATLFAQSGRGDVIELKDGRKISGSLSRTGDVVTIKSDDGKSINVKPADISRVTLTSSTPNAAITSRIRRSEITPYAIIPLNGAFGEEIHEDIIEASVSAASRCGAKYVFFSMNSGGGRVVTAEKISDIIRKFSKDIKFVCFVSKQALSASIWVAFSCDAIFMAEDGVLGAAVPYSRGASGNAQVDAKMNSALAAEVATIAESKGYPVPIIRAMMQLGAEAYAWRDASGKWSFGAVKPAGSVLELITLSNGNTILTLTAKEAIRIGIAKPSKSIQECALALGLPNPMKVTVETEQLAILQSAVPKVMAYNNAHGKFLGQFDEEQTYNNWAQTTIKAVGRQQSILAADGLDYIVLNTTDIIIQSQTGRLFPRAASLAAPYHGGSISDPPEWLKSVDRIFAEATYAADAVVREWQADTRKLFAKLNAPKSP